METYSLEIDSKTNNFLLRLPAPHDSITLTCPRLEDVEDILPILNDERVYPWMGPGLPHPHQHEHALRWINSVKPCCDSAQDEIKSAQRDGRSGFAVSDCPVRIIREDKPGQKPVYLGDCGFVKWRFSDLTDEEQRQALIQENENKSVGDPTIVWSIGYYLSPDYSGKGIMTSVIGTLIKWAMKNMGVMHIRASAIEQNEPSIKVLTNNGFNIEKTMPKFALKKGERVDLHILDWKAPAGL